MTTGSTLRNDTSPIAALSGAVIGAAAVLVIALLPHRDAWLPIWLPAGLLGLWLCAASLVSYFNIRSSTPATARQHRPIRLRFAGPTGRFRLRPRADGRRVEVIAGPQVVAELNATAVRDEIILNAGMVPDAELDDLGSAIGQAIEMVAAADEDGADR